ncbi:MAG: restriction endonuclease subunit S [Deltaproteobacteria bacterium]|nr:restriction endonuclease subunit S [Deltaproteobacteria bacterium]
MNLQCGFPFRSSDFKEEPVGPRLLLGANVAPGRADWAKSRYWPSTASSNLDVYHLRPGDVVLAMDRPWIPSGLKLFRVSDDDVPSLLVQRVARLRPQLAQQLDSGFLYAALCHPSFTAYLLAVQTGSTVPHISATQISDFDLPIPPLDEQRRIAGVLGALDDKIELNRKMNRTLEDMAQAIFKSWFIDFDGVPASELVESEGCRLPRGWRFAVVADIVSELETGSRPTGGVGSFSDGVPSIGAESIDGLGVFDFSKTKYVPVDFFRRLRQGVLKSRDVLIYKDGGKPGDFRPHVGLLGDGFPFAQCAINSHVYRLRVVEPLTQEFAYFWFASDPVMAEMRRLGTGVAIPSLPRRNLLKMRVLVPCGGSLGRFGDLVSPMVGHILSNARESRTLAALRDALLPKLISGEIRVPEAEAAVEAVL